MALDIAALKSKLNSFKRSTVDRSEVIWKPREGKQIIRIVPWKDRPTNPFIELHFHYLGNKTYLSPISYGERDPIAEFAQALMDDQDRDPKERYAEARPFRPKLRTYVPIIVRGEEEKGVRFYSFGKTVYEDLLAFIADPDYGDITDVESGRDITLEYIPKEKSDTNFAKTKVVAKPKETPLSQDDELVQKWLTEQPNIDELYNRHTYNELNVALQQFLDPDANVSASSESSETEAPKSAVVEKSSSKEKVKDVMDDFEAAFNE